MPNNIQTITIIGDGGWGTTLASYLALKKYRVILWGAFPDYVEILKKKRVNTKFLPGHKIPSSVTLTSDLKFAIAKSDLIVLATPSQYLRGTLQKIKRTGFPKDKIFLSVVKGIDPQTLQRMSEVIYEELGLVKLAVLSGPTIASELAAGVLTTAVIGCDDLSLAQKLQKVFHSEIFRIYINTDVIGVELGGSVKNVIALAGGICDGMGLGTNAKAALMTRGLVEMSRLGQALGAKKESLFGLTGLGDLITTCMNTKSRNRTVGEQIGRGKKINTILSGMEMVAEGVITTKAVYKLGKKLGVKMPITEEVYKVIYNNKNIKKAITDLMLRDLKHE